MCVSLLQSLLNPTTTFKLSFLPPPPLSLLSTTHSLIFCSSSSSSSYQTLKFPAKNPHSLSPENNAVVLSDFQDFALGDCLVFEDGAFENPHVRNTFFDQDPNSNQKKKKKTKKPSNDVSPENLVPEKWRMVQEELNLTKKEKRKIAQEIEFGSRVEKRRLGYKPLKSIDLQEYLEYKKAKLAELNPIKLVNPTSFRVDKVEAEELTESSERVAPRNPRWAVYGRGLEDVSNFFNSEKYVVPDKKTVGNGLVAKWGVLFSWL